MFPHTRRPKRLTFETSTGLRFTTTTKEKPSQPGTVTTEGRGWLAMRDTLGLVPGTTVQLTGHPDSSEISIEVISHPGGRDSGGGSGSGDATQQAAADGRGAGAAAQIDRQHLRPEEMIRRRVAVHWDGNDTHFPATVVSYNAACVSP